MIIIIDFILFYDTHGIFTKYTKLAIMALIPTLYSHIFAVFINYLDPKMLDNVELDVCCQKGLPFKIVNFIGLFNFEWHGYNKVGNICIFVLCRDCEKPS